jgi:malectin (di-glucose binding ER protein)
VRKLFCVLAFMTALYFPKGVLAQQPIRVNCGGASYTDSKGQVWNADYGFNSGALYSAASPISGTTDQKLYQTERYGNAIIYSFPLANGNYSVNVLLAEIYSPYFKAGARVMNIKVQGVLAFSNVDIFAQAGADAALTKSTTAVVSNGTLTVELDNVVGGSKCSAIEILPVPTGPSLLLNFTYPDGTPVPGNLAYTVSSSLLSFQGSSPLNNGQANCIIYANPSALGISAQFTVNLSLTDTAGHTLWQLTVAMNPSQVNLGAVQSSALNVVVQKI